MTDAQHEEYQRLNAEEDAAYNEYFELRDAKSNGCCHGWSIPAILEYDDKIMAAHRRLEEARQKLHDFIKLLP